MYRENSWEKLFSDTEYIYEKFSARVFKDFFGTGMFIDSVSLNTLGEVLKIKENNY